MHYPFIRSILKTIQFFVKFNMTFLINFGYFNSFNKFFLVINESFESIITNKNFGHFWPFIVIFWSISGHFGNFKEMSFSNSIIDLYGLIAT